MISAQSLSRRAYRALLGLLLAAAFMPRAAAAEPTYHLLQKGETLYSVAKSYGVKLDDLVTANSIDDPAKVRVGMKLIIPGDSGPAADAPSSQSPSAPTGAIKYKVAKGDTLFSIAKAYGVSVDVIRKANKLNPISLIKPGDTLTIPGAAPKAGAVPQSAVSPPASATAPAVPEAVKTTAKAVSSSVTWPCPGEILYLDGKAYGIVIRSKLGEAQKAVASGTVSSAGPYRGYGNVVFVLSRTGYIYVYGGNESLSVRAGDKVGVGQELGKIGMDAKQGGPAAYFLVFKNGEAVDPAQAPRD